MTHWEVWQDQAWRYAFTRVTPCNVMCKVRFLELWSDIRLPLTLLSSGMPLWVESATTEHIRVPRAYFSENALLWSFFYAETFFMSCNLNYDMLLRDPGKKSKKTLHCMCKNYKSNDTLLPGEIVISLKKSAKKKYLDPTVHLIYDSVSVHIDTVYGTQSMWIIIILIQFININK